MSFRTVVVKSRCKLEYSLNHLVCVKGDEVTRILLDEIKMVVIESTQVSITTTLIAECLSKKIKVLFSDSKYNLTGELTPFYNNYYAYRKIKSQLAFKEETKAELRTSIVKRKIYMQKCNLDMSGKEESTKILNNYLDEVEFNDMTNREGLAAKVYFFALFGTDFNRKDDKNEVNMFLNYGYSILLSSFNRAIKALGYYTELGIHHVGDSNTFNLSCDFMEIIRPLVDLYIIKNKVTKENFKEVFINMLSLKVKFKGKELHLDNAIEAYVENNFNILLNDDVEKIRYIDYEL